MDPGGLPKNSKKVNERGRMQRFMIERGNPLSTDLTSDERLSRIYVILLQIDRLQLTAVYCNRRGCVKTAPQKTRFRSVNNYKELQGIHMQVKSEYVGTLTMTEMMTRMRRATSTTTCLTWT